MKIESLTLHMDNRELQSAVTTPLSTSVTVSCTLST